MEAGVADHVWTLAEIVALIGSMAKKTQSSGLHCSILTVKSEGMMAATWRKRKGGYDSWHFCANCNNWPKEPGTYDEKTTKPADGGLCNECKNKKAANNCT
jgi:hypothetical protein